MEFRKVVMITLYGRQQKRYRCIEQSFGPCGRERGWDDLGEWHWNMYNIICETSCQSRFDARYWMLGASALGQPRGMVWGGRRKEGSGWGTHVYRWQIHFDIWQNQYNIVKLNKIKLEKKIKKKSCFSFCFILNCLFWQLYALFSLFWGDRININYAPHAAILEVLASFTFYSFFFSSELFF